MAKEHSFSIGVDFGTNSVRALLVNTENGVELASEVYAYPSGRAGILLDPRDPNVARQHPGDYIKGFHATVAGVVRTAAKRKGFRPERVVGIGVDTTGSTPLPVNADGTPLALQAAFRKHPAAQAWLWKDHTAFAEAAEITELARQRNEPYLAKCGGTYSSEWFWSKILHCARTAPDVFDAAFSWVEACDFIPAYATGNTHPLTLPRGICAAGHKAMFSEDWGGLPSEAFLAALSPKLAELRQRLYTRTHTADQRAGGLCPRVAKAVGLPPGTPVAVGGFDAHFGAVGAGIKPGTLVKIIGTSTCDMMVARTGELADIPGVCGIVPGSILPGLTGLEAGQSAVGDILLWFIENLCPARYATRGNPFQSLEREARTLLPGETGLMALDWNNGNRTILVDPLLTGLLVGQTLHTRAPEVLRALIEATAFGALTIIQRFEEYGVPVRDIVACGGLAEKDPLMMQILADVCGRPIRLSRSAQTCALGAAVFGALAGGRYRTVSSAQRAMTAMKDRSYYPRRSARTVYAELYAIYRDLHDAFGVTGTHPSMDTIMKRLISLRDRVRATRTGG